MSDDGADVSEKEQKVEEASEQKIENTKKRRRGRPPKNSKKKDTKKSESNKKDDEKKENVEIESKKENEIEKKEDSKETIKKSVRSHSVDADSDDSDVYLNDKVPPFDRPEGHVFQEEENVFVIDPNGFDIWEAQITKIVNDRYAVHYPEYPQDDEELTTARLLVASEKNQELFLKMENNRQRNTEIREQPRPSKRSPGRKKKVPKKKKEQGTRHNPLRGPTIVKKKY